MSWDRKVIEYEGVKYCKEEDFLANRLVANQFYVEFDESFDVEKNVDILFKILAYEGNKFSSISFENLSSKLYNCTVELPISDSTINRYQEHKPLPKLYDFELYEHRFCDFGMCEQKYKFFKPEPRLYEFELGEELEKKWKDVIKNSIPMFLTSLTPYVNTNIVVCELEQNDKLEKETDMMFYDDHPLNIVRNHLVANEFNIEFGKRFDFDVEKKADVVLEILANGGDKFSNIYLEYLHSKLYNLIIEVCKTYYRGLINLFYGVYLTIKMSEDRKIIEHEGFKYYKEDGQWYRMLPIKEDEMPDVIKTKRQSKFNLLPEIQLDIFKCLDFTQLLSVQQANVYFKNFIYEHGKVLAMKKFHKLEFVNHLVNNATINRYKEHVPQPKLYDFELEEHRFCDFGMCQQKYKFFKPEPRLYEFELGEELEMKWKDGIKHSIPMFLTSDNAHINTVVCELVQNYKEEKELKFYDFELSEELEEKWNAAIEKSIPMFLESRCYAKEEKVLCELYGQNFNDEK
uniref:F-box domain-containing protein n=1 Tax=Meloidogyne javanica TaxID=6303 RepID=A0A915M0M0_MELJA